MTTYTHLTDEEFLNTLDDARHYSPVIKELCRRLEAKSAEDQRKAEIAESTNQRAECPVCEAALEVEYDGGNDLFELRIAKD